ncbi:hypothetical protein protein [Bacillus cereus G9241]|nr:hypothetical protein protein [Bacillus cereus G9241]
MQKIPFLITYKWGTVIIGMYKEVNRVIEKEKGEFLLKVGIRLFLATNNETLY